MSTEIKPKEDEGINFILWIIFILLLGSGAILLSYGEEAVLKMSGISLFLSALIFWFSVNRYSKRKSKTIKNTENFKKG